MMESNHHISFLVTPSQFSFVLMFKCSMCHLNSESAAAAPAPKFESPVQISFDGDAAKFDFKLASPEGAKIVW